MGPVSKAIGGGVAAGVVGAGGALAFVNEKIAGVPWWGQVIIAGLGFCGGFGVGFMTTYSFPKNTEA